MRAHPNQCLRKSQPVGNQKKEVNIYIYNLHRINEEWPGCPSAKPLAAQLGQDGLTNEKPIPGSDQVYL